MHISRYRIYKAILAGGLSIALAIAIMTGTAIIALMAVIVAVILAFIIERNNKEIVKDERIQQINCKAAYISFNIVIVFAALASLCTAIFRSQLPENIVFTGSIMGYFTCGALLVFMCVYAYFSHKL